MAKMLQHLQLAANDLVIISCHCQHAIQSRAIKQALCNSIADVDSGTDAKSSMIDCQDEQHGCDC